LILEKYSDFLTEPPGISYEDYMAMPEYPKIELIEGEIYQMPDPSTIHQMLSAMLSYLFMQYKFAHNLDYIVLAPCNYQLTKFYKNNGKPINLIPDLALGPPSVVDKNGFISSPLLVVEILSPSNKAHDTIRKYEYYREEGVNEYWIVDPESKTIQVNLLVEGVYQERTYTTDEYIDVSCLPGLRINVEDVFRV
jgi:Uma2 family endonuclease